MLDFYSSPLLGQINALVADDASLREANKKVGGKIRKYALSINVAPENLLVSHIADDCAHLRKGFVSFIEKSPGKPGAKPERIKLNREEIYCRLGKLLTAVFDAAKSGEADLDGGSGNNLSESFLEQQAPEWMNPLINILGREGGSRFGKIKGFDRLKLPLTSLSVDFLSVILKVSRTMKCSSLKSLLVDFRLEIAAEIRRRHLGRDAQHLCSYLSKVRAKLGFHVGHSGAFGSLPFEQWSPKFQEQWNTYEKLAATGVFEHSDLGKEAARYKISVGKSKAITVAGYKNRIGIGLFHCRPLPGDWGVEDLLSLEERKTTIARYEISEFYNSFVERYQNREQNRESISKRKGFHSRSFGMFIDGLTTVATFNGLFHLVDPFRRAYRMNPDVESKKLKKDAKKELFSVAENDENIDRLEIEFNRIVKDGLFERRAGVNKIEADRNMRLCLFLPIFTAIRFLGLRQKNIRNFRLMRAPENPTHPDGNIGFRNDGTLVVHFTKEETKNKKPLHHEFNPADCETHAPLIRILSTYYKKVYLYISKNAVSSLDGQFFAYMPSKFPGKFAFFPDHDGKFRNRFVGWGDEFLIYRNMTANKSLRLNPHHLRGNCVDWLKNVLKLSWAEIAEYIADTEEMLRGEYADRYRVHDATSIIEDKNRNRRAAQAEKEAIEATLRAAEQAKIEAVKRAERDDIKDKQMNRLEQMMNRMDSANAALAAENALLKELLAEKSGAGSTGP
jgi:hypothetical protein